MNIAPRNRQRSNKGKNCCTYGAEMPILPVGDYHNIPLAMTARLSCSLCDTPVLKKDHLHSRICLSAIRTPHPLQISALPFNSSILRPVTLRRQLRCLRAVQGEDGVFRELLLPHFLPFTSWLREEVQVFRNRPSTSRCWHRASDLRQRQHKSNSCIQHWGKI